MRTDLKQHSDKTLNLLLGAGSVICICLLMIRTCISSNLHYYFLIWNLLLAWIPFLISSALTKAVQRGDRNWKTTLLFFSWLLFFPNAPYIITDLFHFHQKPMVPLWFDLVVIISFAWNGLMLGFISLMSVQHFLNKKYSIRSGWFMITVILFLCGFGIYLGRYQRWNSWDLLTNPVLLISDVGDHLLHPFLHPRTIGVTLLFAVFLLINYITLCFLVKSRKDEG
jgi:uncharacterized membrane protein